jgi:hypothetical protein
MQFLSPWSADSDGPLPSWIICRATDRHAADAHQLKFPFRECLRGFEMLEVILKPFDQPDETPAFRPERRDFIVS